MKENKLYTFNGTNHFMLVSAKNINQAKAKAWQSASPIDIKTGKQIRGARYTYGKPKVLKIWYLEGQTTYERA